MDYWRKKAYWIASVTGCNDKMPKEPIPLFGAARKFNVIIILQQNVKIVQPLSFGGAAKNTQSIYNVAGRGYQLVGRYRSEIGLILFI